MIKIDCFRDEKGFYDIDNINKKTYKICFRVRSERKNSENFWCCPKNGATAPFIVKFMNKPGYIFALYSELIVSGLCKQNKVPCANIDVGKCNNNFCVISEDVSFGADERFSTYELARLSGNSETIMYPDERADHYYVENLFKLAQRACKVVPNLKLDPNFLMDLYKLAFVDLMVSQEDRNPSNLMFTIRKKGFHRVLSVAPMFDNEYSFSFMRLIPRFKTLGVEPYPVITAENPERNQVVRCVNAKTYENNQYLTPILGIKQGLEHYVYPLKRGTEGELELHRSLAKSINEDAYTDMAKVFLENPGFARFCTYFVADTEEIGNKIYEESGFKIPPIYLNMAQAIISDNYKRFVKYLKKEKRSQRKAQEKYSQSKESQNESSPLL